jgi:hypothetical protein
MSGKPSPGPFGATLSPQRGEGTGITVGTGESSQ